MVNTGIEDAYIGVDLGTQSVRALALDTAGHVLAAEQAPLTSRRDRGRHEQDPEQWWSAAAEVLRGVTERLGTGRGRIRGVATCGTSGTFALLDPGGHAAAGGHATTPGIMYDDARAVGHEAPRQREAAEWLAAALGYRMQPTWALPKLAALAADGVSPGSRPAHQPDVINARLVGDVVATDTSSALKTGVDPRHARWPEPVRAVVEPAIRLPEVVGPGTVIGTVSGEAARETGLPRGTPVVAGMTDGCAAQLAAGALEVGDVNSVLGTTLVCKAVSRELIHDPSGVTYSHRSADGAWLPGAASSAGLAVVTDLFAGADLNTLAAEGLRSVPPSCYPLLGSGERFPFSHPEAAGFVVVDGRRLPLDANTRDTLGAPTLFGAILTGIAYTERMCFEVLADTGYATGGRIRLTGGATRNPLLTALRAGVLDRTVEVPDHAEPAAGMAVLAAWSQSDGETLAECAGRMVTVAGVVAPSDARGLPSRSTLDEGYERFRAELRSSGWLGTSVVGDPR